MTEQNFDVNQTAESRSYAPASATPENPTGDLAVKTPYDYMREAFEKEIANEPITLEVPNRPGVYIEYDTNITSEQIEMWRKQATIGNRRQRRSGDQEVDSVKFMALVVFNKATIFLVDGQEVYLDPPTNSKPMNFFEQEALRQLANTNATTDTELVRAVFKNDAHVLAAGGQITEAAGYGEELAEMQENPTVR